MVKKSTIDKIMICILLVMQLGFHTNTPYDDLISSVCTFAIFIYFVLCRGKITSVFFTKKSLGYILWYTGVVFICVISYTWSTGNNFGLLKELVLYTYIPVVLTAVCVAKFIKLGGTGIQLLELFIYAEILVIFRALLNTPFKELFLEFDTRVYGTNLGVNYNHFTTQFALSFCIVLYLTYNYNRKYLTALLFILTNIVISGSRKVIIVSAIAFAVMYILSAKRQDIGIKVKRVLIIIGLILIGCIVIFTNDYLYQLIGEKTAVVLADFNIYIPGIDVSNVSDFSSYQRATLRESAMETFKKNPLLGVGYYCYKQYNKWGLYAHNNYLEILADLGIVGFCMYYSFYVGQLYEGIKGRKHYKSKRRLYRWNALCLPFMLVLFVIEYGQVTFFRLYALIPLLIVTVAIEDIKKHEVGLTLQE